MTKNEAVNVIWDYMHMDHQLQKADAILALGSHDTRVAEYAADLFLQEYAPYLIFSGGYGRLIDNDFKKPEADLFAEIANERGVPESAVLIENKSTNTGENVELTKQLLTEKRLHFDTFILVQKPYMERRTYATFKQVWPEKECIVTSPPLSFDEYLTDEIDETSVINIMVGDLQRIKEYPTKGFQIPQEIPDDVWSAYEFLVDQGYTDHLIKK